MPRPLFHTAPQDKKNENARMLVGPWAVSVCHLGRGPWHWCGAGGGWKATWTQAASELANFRAKPKTSLANFKIKRRLSARVGLARFVSLSPLARCQRKNVERAPRATYLREDAGLVNAPGSGVFTLFCILCSSRFMLCQIPTRARPSTSHLGY